MPFLSSLCWLAKNETRFNYEIKLGKIDCFSFQRATVQGVADSDRKDIAKRGPAEEGTVPKSGPVGKS